MIPWLFLPEVISVIAFLLKRLIPDEKLAESLCEEAVRRIGSGTVDGDSVEGFRRQLLDALEIDGIRKDIQAVSLAAFASTLMLAASPEGRGTAFQAAVIWAICYLANARFAALAEGVRRSSRARLFHVGAFACFWALSLGLKFFKILRFFD